MSSLRRAGRLHTFYPRKDDLRRKPSQPLLFVVVAIEKKARIFNLSVKSND